MSILRHRRHHFPILIILLLILTQGHQKLQEALASPTSQLTHLTVAANRRPFLYHPAVQNWDNGPTMRYYHVNHGGDNNRHYVPGDMAVLNNEGGDQQLAVPVKRASKSGLKGGGGHEDDMIVGGQDYGTQRQLYEDFLSFHPRKRGFSVLARWKPFTNINKLRVSSRRQQQQQHMLRPAMINQAQVQQLLSSGAAADDYDVISAETRALLLRPSGQPLRWG